MSYLSLQGQVMEIYKSPKGVNRQTGEEYGGSHYVQMLCDDVLRNGERKLSLFTLRTDEPEAFERFKGSTVSVPVGAFARDGTIAFYLAKGQAPQALPESAS